MSTLTEMAAVDIVKSCDKESISYVNYIDLRFVAFTAFVEVLHSVDSLRYSNWLSTDWFS